MTKYTTRLKFVWIMYYNVIVFKCRKLSGPMTLILMLCRWSDGGGRGEDATSGRGRRRGGRRRPGQPDQLQHHHLFGGAQGDPGPRLSHEQRGRVVVSALLPAPRDATAEPESVSGPAAQRVSGRGRDRHGPGGGEQTGRRQRLLLGDLLEYHFLLRRGRGWRVESRVERGDVPSVLGAAHPQEKPLVDARHPTALAPHPESRHFTSPGQALLRLQPDRDEEPSQLFVHHRQRLNRGGLDTPCRPGHRPPKKGEFSSPYFIILIHFFREIPFKTSRIFVPSGEMSGMNIVKQSLQTKLNS